MTGSSAGAQPFEYRSIASSFAIAAFVLNKPDDYDELDKH
jgi:hypothetical protein